MKVNENNRKKKKKYENDTQSRDDDVGYMPYDRGNDTTTNSGPVR